MIIYSFCLWSVSQTLNSANMAEVVEWYAIYIYFCWKSHVLDWLRSQGCSESALVCSKDKAEKINTNLLFENTFNRFIKTQKTHEQIRGKWEEKPFTNLVFLIWCSVTLLLAV